MLSNVIYAFYDCFSVMYEHLELHNPLANGLKTIKSSQNKGVGCSNEIITRPFNPGHGDGN